MLNSGFVPEKEDTLRFTSYLIHDFYSFGKMTTYIKDYTDQARLTVTEKIDYYRVNVEGQRLLEFRVQPQIPVAAPIYDIFRHSIEKVKAKKNEPDPKITPKEVLGSTRNEASKKITTLTISNNAIIRKTKKFIKYPKRSVVDIVNKRLG